jgi:two-component system sensor histidine kinase KdpD
MSPRTCAGDAVALEIQTETQTGLTRGQARLSGQILAYLWGAIAVLLSTELALVASRYLELADIIMLHLIGVVVIATRFDVAVSVFTAIASVLAFDFFFVPPVFTFTLPDVKSVITCAGMLVVAVVISGLTTRARRFERAARSRETRAALLYELSRELVEASTPSELTTVAVSHFERLLGTRVALLVPHGHGGKLTLADTLEPVWLSQAELARADEIWRRGKDPPWLERLVRFTTTPVTHYFFLTGAGAPLGLLVVRGPGVLFADAAERDFFDVCTHQAALALERAEFAAKAAAAELAAHREHVQNTLLRSISHDFRTPLAAIVGAGMSLADYDPTLDPEARATLERTIVEQGQRLNRLLTNVLSVTRLDHGELRLDRLPCSLDEIVESALRHLAQAASKRRVNVNIPFDLPLVDVDALLFEQLVLNVVENAFRYSPRELEVDIAARAEDDRVVLEVSDRGPGVSPGDEQRMFERFYRGAAASASDGGLGLGLTICQAVAQAHGGSIRARNRPAGGLCVTTTLPRAADRFYPSALESPLLSAESA